MKKKTTGEKETRNVFWTGREGERWSMVVWDEEGEERRKSFRTKLMLGVCAMNLTAKGYRELKDPI